MKKMKVAFILLIAALVVSGLVFSLYAKSKFSSIKSLRTSIEEFQKKNREAIESHTDELQILKELFPEADNITEFIETAYRISKLQGIKNLTFEQRNREFIELSSGKTVKTRPDSGKKVKGIYAYPVKISFDSGYRNMAEFIREIQNQNRMVTIGNLMAKRDTDHLSVEMVVTIYSTEEK